MVSSSRLARGGTAVVVPLPPFASLCVAAVAIILATTVIVANAEQGAKLSAYSFRSEALCVAVVAVLLATTVPPTAVRFSLLGSVVSLVAGDSSCLPEKTDCLMDHDPLCSAP